MNKKAFLGIVLAFVAASASAELTPQRINFQGKLIVPGTNNPNTSATVNLEFCLYNSPTAGSCASGALYTETQNNVPLTNGVFSVQIGSITGISRDLFVGASVYLGVTVVGDSEMSPRQNLVNSAYAFSANQLTDNTEVRLIAGITYSTFTSAGNFTVPGGITGSSGTFLNGITASSGTFLSSGGNTYSVVAASGIYMSSGTLNIDGGGGINNQYGILTASLTATGGVTAASGTFSAGITASSGTFLATGGSQFSLTTSSGINMSAGTLHLTGTSGIRADDTGITISTIDFTGQATDPSNGNAGYMYYNTSTGSLKVFDTNGWEYSFGQSLSRSFFITTTNSAAIAVSKTAAQMIVEPFYLPGPMMVRQIQVDETTAVGAAGDFGIYTSTGGLYLHGGASSLAASTGLKTVTVTGGPVFVPPGQYFAVITFNSATGRFAGDTLVSGMVPGCGTVASGGGTTLPGALPTPTTAGTIFFMFEMNP